MGIQESVYCFSVTSFLSDAVKKPQIGNTETIDTKGKWKINISVFVRGLRWAYKNMLLFLSCYLFVCFTYGHLCTLECTLQHPCLLSPSTKQIKQKLAKERFNLSVFLTWQSCNTHSKYLTDPNASPFEAQLTLTQIMHWEKRKVSSCNEVFSALANMIPRYTSLPPLETCNVSVSCLHLTVEIIWTVEIICTTVYVQ